MNLAIFQDTLYSIDVNDFVLKAAQTDDLIGAVLRLHLVGEKIIEAWICAASGFSNFFLEDKNKQFIIECDIKLKIAKNMGLPKSLCTTLKTLNSLRNSIAHDPKLQDIEPKKIDSMMEGLRNHLNDNGKRSLKDQRIKISNPSKTGYVEVGFDTNDISNKIKLSLILNILVGEIHKEVAALAKLISEENSIQK